MSLQKSGLVPKCRASSWKRSSASSSSIFTEAMKTNSRFESEKMTVKLRRPPASVDRSCTPNSWIVTFKGIEANRLHSLTNIHGKMSILFFLVHLLYHQWYYMFCHLPGTQTSHWELYRVPLNAIRPFRVEFEVHKGAGNSPGFSSGWCPQTMTNSSRATCMETDDCFTAGTESQHPAAWLTERGCSLEVIEPHWYQTTYSLICLEKCTTYYYKPCVSFIFISRWWTFSLLV